MPAERPIFWNRLFTFVMAAAIAASMSVVPAKPTLAAADTALDLGSSGAYVTFGVPAKLGLGQFTIETWFKKTGAGTPNTTGGGGITILPLVTHGAPQAENSDVDANWILGITNVGGDNLIAADFEASPGGQNYPVWGNTPILDNTWYHAAATYDGTSWALYLNGSPETITCPTTCAPAAAPRSDSRQGVGLGTMITTDDFGNMPSYLGRFAGVIDEARVWDHARTAGQILANRDLELTSGTGLVARWGMNDGSGSNVTDSITSPSAADGTIGGTGYSWVDGFTVAPPPPGNKALDLGSSGAYVTFGVPAKLGLGQFTIETWFKKTGAGTPNTTGGGGITILPLVTHGAPQAENSDVDANWILGITNVGGDNLIAADFEASPGGQNYPVWGNTPILDNTWYHAAATYDGTSWALYLNGSPETITCPTTCAPAAAPRSDSRQGVGLGTMITTDDFGNMPSYLGRFAGVIDEARVWDHARTAGQILANRDLELTSGTGLVARWGMNDGSGSNVTDSITSPSAADGTIGGTGYSWVDGFPIPGVNNVPVAVADSYSTPQDTALNVAAPGVLGNDNDADLDPLTAILVADVSHGSLTLNADGSFSYTPNTGYTGPDSFTYHASDGTDDSNIATVSLTINAAGNTALDLGSTSAYVTFGDPDKLDLAQFTIETWFKKTGPGTSSTTGTNGFAHAIPLVTHGAPDVDNHDNNDEDWILAIDADTNTIAADFEQGAGGTTPSSNNPVHGTTAITENVWHHAAATYDGTTLNLYLDGNLDATVAIGEPTRSDTIEQAALGTMLTANGTAKGYFDGVLDEVRVWDHALTGTQIATSMTEELTSGPGLVARWGLNEGSGTTVGDSIANPANGTIMGTGYSWVTGAPFNVSSAPDDPILVAPADGASGISTSPTLSVTATDPDTDSLDVDFYGRGATGGGPAAPFTLVVMPDAQNYVVSDTAAELFNAQTQWIADQQSTLNTVFASQLGDVTENGTVAAEWARASTAMGILDSAGIPYSITVGNHDGYASGYPTFLSTFGASRYAGKTWYGGYLGDPSDGVDDFGQNRGNLDSYELFSADGMDFIVLNLELDSPTAYHVADWADAVLAAHSNRRAIVITHAYLTTAGARASSPYFLGSGGTSAADLWQSVLSQHCNVFMVLSGHEPGESRLTSTNACGQPVHQLLQDYQNYSNGGDGWLRYYVFDPANNQIDAYTYSPVLDQYETDASSQFTLGYDMQAAAFNLIDTQTVTSGDTASTTWSGLDPGTTYEWYVVVRDGSHETTGPTWTFTTGGAGSNNPPVADDQTISLPAGASTGGSLTASDADSDPLTYTILTAPTKGSVTLNDATTGSFTYVALPSASGSDSFTFKANDGTADSNTATVTINLQAGQGYWQVASDGGIFTFGNAGFFGSTGGQLLDQPVVGMAPTPTRDGYWLVAADGGIFTFGDAGFFGSTGGGLVDNVVGMAATPSGNGYWLVGADGQVYNFGDAQFLGSMGGQTLDQPMVGMAATPSGDGYWLVASDGGIFAFGDAGFYGSTGGQTLDQPVVGMAPTASGNGYWLVASDGGIFTFGDAGFYGSTGGQTLDQPVVGMAPTPSGNGYWLVASDGGIFAFGDAGFYGSMGGQPLFRPMVGMGG